LSELLKPLLGRARSRGRCWAAIRNFIETNLIEPCCAMLIGRRFSLKGSTLHGVNTLAVQRSVDLLRFGVMH